MLASIDLFIIFTTHQDAIRCSHSTNSATLPASPTQIGRFQKRCEDVIGEKE